MARNKEIVVKGFLKKEDGDVVPLESLTPEEKADVQAKWRKRLSESMSRYFAARPAEEYIRFIEALEAEEKRQEEEAAKEKLAAS